MANKKSRNWFWIYIIIFAFFWLGDQLLKAIYTAEIKGFKFESIISFEQEPVWFVLMVLAKSVLFIGSAVFLYFQFIHKSYR